MQESEKQRDPICGMPVLSTGAPSVTRDAQTFVFCSEFCRTSFLALPAGAGARMDAIPASRRIAYLSMEIALDQRLPTYAGGLGVLAGDMLRACADLRIPIVAVTLLHRKGYFRQRLQPDGGQEENPEQWQPSVLLQLLPQTASGLSTIAACPAGVKIRPCSGRC